MKFGIGYQGKIHFCLESDHSSRHASCTPFELKCVNLSERKLRVIIAVEEGNFMPCSLFPYVLQL